MALSIGVKSFLKSDRFPALVLGLLPVLAYVPALVMGLSLNPWNFGSGLLSDSHRGVTAGGPWLDPNTSFTIQALGGLSAEDWLHGRVPWWNPYTGVGLPLAAEMQSVSLFLPFVLLLHFANGAIYLKIALQIVAGLASYALLRQLGLRAFSSLAGAALYQLSGPFAWFAHGPIMPMPFLPLLLLGIERASESAKARRRGGWAIIAAALAYSLYAGFPETAFIDGLLALVWTLCRLTTAGKARLAFAAKVTIGGAAGLLLAAPVLFPFWEYQAFSSIGHTFPTDGLSKLSLAPLFMPYIFGPIGAFSAIDSTQRLANFWGANGGYLNLTVLFLATLGVLSGNKDRALRIALGAWLAIFLGRLMNVFHLGYLLSFIPLIKVVAVDRYCEPAWSMAAAILAAYALEDWRAGTRSRRIPVLVSSGVTIALGITALYLASSLIKSLSDADSRHYSIWLWGSIAGFLLFTLAIALLYQLRRSRRAIFAMGTLVILNALVLYAIPTLAGLRRSQIDDGLITFLQKHLNLQRFYTLGPFAPNYGAYFEAASINHNAVPVPSEWIQYIDSTLDPDSVIHTSSLFVGYFPGPFADREKALRTHLRGFESTAVKYVLTQPGSDPFSVRRQAGMPDFSPDQERSANLVYRGRVADVFELLHPADYFETQGGACTLSAGTRDLVQADCRSRAMLIRREFFYPGWRVYVNGKESAVSRFSPIFQAIHLPSGKSKIEFSYRPSHIGLTLTLAILGAGLTVAGLIFSNQGRSTLIQQHSSFTQLEVLSASTESS